MCWRITRYTQSFRPKVSPTAPRIGICLNKADRTIKSLGPELSSGPLLLCNNG
jgi:hypothetical protein